MNHPHSPLHRSLLIFASTALLFVVGCHKKPPAPPTPPPAPPPAAAKPTVSISADRTTINKGESAKLTWTTTDATNASISPEVGAVTPQGSTTVTPADSTTYSITATGPGGSSDANVRITVNAPAPVAQTPKGPSFEELFMQEVRDAYFDLARADIRPDARTALEKTASFLKGYPNARVTIEGHCDERGSTEYNLALGDRRANAVQQFLVNRGSPPASLIPDLVG